MKAAVGYTGEVQKIIIGNEKLEHLVAYLIEKKYEVEVIDTDCKFVDTHNFI